MSTTTNTIQTRLASLAHPLRQSLRGWLIVLEVTARLTVATVLGGLGAFYFVWLPLAALRGAVVRGAWGEAAVAGLLALVCLTLCGWLFAHLAGVVGAIRHLRSGYAGKTEVDDGDE
jgi:hypothetical protein